MDALFRVDLTSAYVSHWDLWVRLSGQPKFHSAKLSPAGDEPLIALPRQQQPAFYDRMQQAPASNPLQRLQLDDMLERYLLETLHPFQHEPGRIIHSHKAIASQLLLDRELSEAFWRQLARNGEGSFIVHCWKGLLLAKLSRVDEANAEFEKAVECVDARDWQPFWLLLHSQLELGFYHEAKENKDKALHRCPGLDRELSLRG